MNKIKYTFYSLITCSLMLSCGGSEETEEVEETTTDTDTTAIIEEEIDDQIVEDLDNETFKKYWQEKGGLLIDLRTPAEVEGGSIEGAINIDFNAGEFDTAIDTLDMNTPTFVYCQGGGRSGNARDMLKDKGFVEVYNLENGYGSWVK